MSRPLRVQRPDAWYHITGRGTERRLIFRTDRDYQHWLELILELTERFRLQVMAYAMMPNHYHLVAAAPEMNLSRAMQWFQTSYSMWFNCKQGRVGPLFQGRFGSAVVEPAVYGLELSRYVHLNPVRVMRLGLDRQSRQAARLGLGNKVPPAVIRQRLEDLRAFRWSSYRAYIGTAEPPQWLDLGPILARCGKGSLTERHQAYRRYVEEAIREGVEESGGEILVRQGVWGSKKWINAIGKTLQGHREQPKSRSLQVPPGV